MTPPSPRPVGFDAATVATVAAGGAVGSLGRYAVGLALPHTSGGFPWGTWLVNVSGCLAMGLLVAWLVMRPGAHRLARPFVGVGLLGGWTTFSTLAIETVGMISEGSAALALGYLTMSFTVGILAVLGGTLLGERLLAAAESSGEAS